MNILQSLLIESVDEFLRSQRFTSRGINEWISLSMHPIYTSSFRLLSALMSVEGSILRRNFIVYQSSLKMESHLIAIRFILFYTPHWPVLKLSLEWILCHQRCKAVTTRAIFFSDAGACVVPVQEGGNRGRRVGWCHLIQNPDENSRLKKKGKTFLISQSSNDDVKEWPTGIKQFRWGWPIKSPSSPFRHQETDIRG